MQEEKILVVCPMEEKNKILLQLQQEKKLHDVKFMTKEEFKENYYFSYNENALFYLLKKYHYHLDVAKIYLENLYFIDDEKKYRAPKLLFLQQLKKELKEEGLLIENPNFSSYLNERKIIVKNYYDLDLYEEKMLNTKIDYSQKKALPAVVECQTMEEEVNFVCLKILSLLKQGIDINKIFLTNISVDYHYIIHKLFSYYHIPIQLERNHSIYGTKVVQDYLKTGQLDLEDKKKYSINKKLVSILSDLINIDDTTKEYQEILIDKLKSTKLPTEKKENAIQIKDLYKESFTDDEYVFVLGMNQDLLPKMEKDIDFINDAIKGEVDLYSTKEKNQRNKNKTIEVLSSINHLFLSYKLSSPFQSFYKSSLINELELKIVTSELDNYNFSDAYNKIRLAEQLDLYHLYGEEPEELRKLYTHYKIPYKTYTNVFSKINPDTYLENLPYPLKLSYTSLNTYSECKFKYYVHYVLKLDPFKDTFASFIGSLYHKILSLYQKSNFDFEIEYQKYLAEHELSLKEKLLLVKIKKDLLSLLEILKKQQLLTGFDDAYFEKKVEIPLQKKVSVLFTGYIDKIMYYKKVEDTYFAIIDYKTGTIDTHLEPMKYGLHMQLPSYLYLMHYAKVFENPIFVGIYYQNILFNYPTWKGKDIEKEQQEKYLLQGYSTDNIDILERFDSTMKQSEYIKSMSYSEEKGFGPHAKVMDDDTLYHLVQYTKKYIDSATDDIIDANFQIDPKVYAGKNISCEFCSFKDLCYKTEKDLIYLDKVEDLSFLGGED